jgi:outer membrane protein OmpA-like peptidoglycan-associated protein
MNAQQKDQGDCNDHPLFTRMPDYWIHNCKEVAFDARAFTIAKGKTEQVEGRLWVINYYPQATAKIKPSELQILRNYENAVTNLGGSAVWVDKSKETLRLNKDGKEFWIEVTTEFTGKYGLAIVEKKGMAQDIVASADALMTELKNTGHVTVNGIYFDTGKSDLKPESEKAIAEIAKLLKADATLKLYVVGHTDNVGGLEPNMKLSQDRAESVMQSLVKTHGVASSRMRAFGNGPYAPVATNDTDEGKAKNRRVELVKQ